MGIRTTLCHKHSTIFECCIGPEEVGIKEAERGKKEMKLRRRSSPYMTKSAMIDYRQRLEEVDIEDEDKESMDEGTMSDI
jgi:hypothetical protein